MNPLLVGIPKETELNVRKRLILVNVLTVMGVTINLIYFLFLFSLGNVMFSLFNLCCAIVLGIFGFYFMKTRKYKTAKLFVLIIVPVVLLLFCLLYGDLGFNLFFVMLSISSFFILDGKKTLLLINLWYFVLFILMNLGIEKNLIVAYDEDLAQLGKIFYWSNVIGGFICTIVIIAVFKVENLRYEISLNEKNNQIQQQNNEISTQHDLLVKTDKTKKKLFSVIAHDLRNPFIGMLYTSEVLIDKIKNDSENRDSILKSVESVHISALRGFKLLENLLDWSRSQTDEIKCNPELINIHEVIQECIQSLHTLIKNKNLNISYNNKPIEVWVDKNMLSSIVRNLLSNAIKYTNTNGTVSIDTKSIDHVLEVKVSDTGVGMTEEFKAKLFRSEFIDTTPGTHNEKGTGLGLLLIKDFVRKNGGDIWAESELGKGSTFYFTIPIAKN